MLGARPVPSTQASEKTARLFADQIHRLPNTRQDANNHDDTPEEGPFVREAIAALRFQAKADVAAAKIRLAFFEDACRPFDTAQNSSGLVELLSAFETQLRGATKSADDPNKLTRTVDAAQTYCSALNDAALNVAQARLVAQNEIVEMVEQLNEGLQEIAQANKDIANAAQSGQSMFDLTTSRTRRLQELSSLLAIHVVARNDAQIAIFSQSGTCLLDGMPVRFGFDEEHAVDPQSGLLMNGIPLKTSFVQKNFTSGKLGALFNVSGQDGETLANALDVLAKDLIVRFQDADIDHTLRQNAAALFTDAGKRLAWSHATGIAARIAVNSALDIGQQGHIFRLRDGLGAMSPAGSVRSTLLRSLLDALTEQRWKGDPKAISALDKLEAVQETVQSHLGQAEEALCDASARLCELLIHDLSVTSNNEERLTSTKGSNDLLLQEIGRILKFSRTV